MRSATVLLLLAAANAGTSPEGKTWLEAKAKEDGVVTLESGLMYKVLRDGDGENHPKASTSCECHYEGKLIDGTVFDSSYERGSPTSFAPNQVIKGWTEAMQLMVEGDKWEMYIPSELGYGDSGSPPKIPGGAPLVFQMEILKINGPTVPADKCDPATKKGCSEREVSYVGNCVEINQCVGCTRQFFTKSFLGDDAAVLAPSSGEEPAPLRHRAGGASMAWRTTRRSARTRIPRRSTSRRPSPRPTAPRSSSGSRT